MKCRNMWESFVFCLGGVWVIHVRGRYIVIYYSLIYIYELFMIYVFVLCFVKSRIYFGLLVFSAHVFMRLLSILGIYKWI